MGTTMDNPLCEWVRGRLPLWAGVGDVAIEPDGEGDDLGVEERRSIERHLGSCASCREHRAGLAQALGALAVAAGALPVAPAGAPSLWPSLERRIAAHDSRTRSRNSRVPIGTGEQGTICADLDDERPLQRAWMQDSLGEMVKAAGLGARQGRSEWRSRDGYGRVKSGGSGGVRTGLRWMVWSGLAASVLALLVAIPAVRRQQADAESTFVANAEPVEGLLKPPSPPVLPAAESPPAPVEVIDRGIPPGELAQADPPRAPEPPPPAADHGAGNRSSGATQFRYDLDHGTPMPPDGRDAKPVY
jgi:hypothetical protein